MNKHHEEERSFLDYPAGPNVITKLLIRLGRQADQRIVVVGVMTEARGWSNGQKGLQTKEYRQTLEVDKRKQIIS